MTLGTRPARATPDARLASWAGALFGLSLSLPGAHAEAPRRVDIQKAYDAAKTVSAGRHQDDLVIRDADCTAIQGGRFACQIDFVLQREPSGRLYFTVVTLEGAAKRWTLIGGLCRGP